GDGLFEARGGGVARGEALERTAEIVLGRGPVERHALAGSFLESVAVGGDGLFEARGAALARAEAAERIAEIVQRRPALLCVLRGAKRKTGDLNRDQKIEIDPLVAPTRIECVLSLAHRL